MRVQHYCCAPKSGKTVSLVLILADWQLPLFGSGDIHGGLRRRKGASMI